MSKISYIEIDKFENINIELLELFLKNNKFKFNTLFSSSVWVKKNIESYNVSFKLLMFFKESELIATHLRFNEFRGFVRIASYQKLFYYLFSKPLKILFPYTIWKTPLLISDNVSNEDLQILNKNFETIVMNLKHVKFSPIRPENCKTFNSEYISFWASYILDLKSKSYDDISSNYTRSLKRSLKYIKTKDEISCKRLDFTNQKDVQRYVTWVRVSQKITGKNYKYDSDIMIKEKKSFSLQSFTYEIFLAINKNEKILGSISLYGDENYVNEFEANISSSAIKLNLRVHDLIRDHIVRFCLDKGIHKYDLSGFNPSEIRSTKEEGIRFGKSKFNAIETHYPILNW